MTESVTSVFAILGEFLKVMSHKVGMEFIITAIY